MPWASEASSQVWTKEMEERPDSSAVRWGRRCEPEKVSPSWAPFPVGIWSGSAPCRGAAQQLRSFSSGCCCSKNSGSPLQDLMCVTLSVLNLHCVCLTSSPVPPHRVSDYCCCCYYCRRCPFGCRVLSVSGTGMRIHLQQGQQESTYCSGYCHCYWCHAGPHQTDWGPISPLRKTSCLKVYWWSL